MPVSHLARCLYHAAAHHHAQMVRATLRAGANPMIAPRGKLPIHAAASFSSPKVAETLELLVNAAPESVCSTDGHARYPLHHILEVHGDGMVAAVATLLEVAPEVADAVDCYGNTPLLLAVFLASGVRPPPEINEVLRMLIAASPRAVSRAGHFNKLPLHCIASGASNVALDAARLLYEVYPAAAIMRDRSGSMPHQGCTTIEMKELQNGWYADMVHSK